MPICPEFRHLYRHQWQTVTRPRVLERAHNKCERCQKPLHVWIFTYLEEPGSAIRRALAFPHDLDQRGFEVLAQSVLPLLAAPRQGAAPQNPGQVHHSPRRQQSHEYGRLESTVLVHVVPSASRPAAPQGDPLPEEGRGPADSAGCLVSLSRPRRPLRGPKYFIPLHFSEKTRCAVARKNVSASIWRFPRTRCAMLTPPTPSNRGAPIAGHPRPTLPSPPPGAGMRQIRPDAEGNERLSWEIVRSSMENRQY